MERDKYFTEELAASLLGEEELNPLFSDTGVHLTTHPRNGEPEGKAELPSGESTCEVHSAGRRLRRALIFLLNAAMR